MTSVINKTYWPSLLCWQKSTQRNPSWLALLSFLNPNMVSELATLSCSRRHHYRLAQRKGHAFFFASSLPQFFLSKKIKKIPAPPPLLSFFYLSHFLPRRDLSERQRIPSACNTAWPVATQEAFDSCWSSSFGKLSNSADTMFVLKHNSSASNRSSTQLDRC